MEWLLAAASIAVLAVSLTAVEGLLRVVDPGYFDRRPSASLDGLHRYSEIYGWELKPGARQRQDDRWVSINARGWRGDNVPDEPTVGRQRVLLLGDSITFGTDVGDGETFADRLAEQGFETVNLAVQGYGLGQSLLKLERQGLGLRPDVVVANVCLANDFADIMLPAFLYDARHPKPYFALRGGRLELHDAHLRLGLAQRAGRALVAHSQLFSRASALAAPAPDEKIAEQARGSWVARRREALRDERAALELGLALLGRMRDGVEATGATFVVALHPDKDAFKHGSSWIEALQAAPQLAGLTVIDLGHEYRRQGLRGRDLLADAIGHLSPEGHRWAAALLGGSLRASRRASRAPGSPAAPRG